MDNQAEFDIMRIMNAKSSKSQTQKSLKSNDVVDLTILIVNFKTKNVTLKCIDSIYQNPPNGTFEVILLDNASNDGIGIDVQREFPDVRYLEVGSNSGFARANNLGIHNAKGDFILLLNSDTTVGKNLLQEMIDYAQFHPKIGVLGPRHVGKSGKFEPSCGKFPTLRREFIRKIVHYRLRTNETHLRDYLDRKHANRGKVDWVSGSCMLIRKKALFDSGLLDERFFMYFEDIDLCRRIQQVGWQICYYPNQTVTHIGGESVKRNILRVMYENRKSQLYFSQIYYGGLGCAIVRITLIFKYFSNLVRALIGMAGSSIRGRSTKDFYAKALISKKVIFLALKYTQKKRKISRLRLAQNAHSDE